MRPRKVYAVYENCEGYNEIRFMFYDKITAQSCAELLKKQQNIENYISSQLEEFGVRSEFIGDSIFTVEEWEIADGDED